jgi:hypothetical protein
LFGWLKQEHLNRTAADLAQRKPGWNDLGFIDYYQIAAT